MEVKFIVDNNAGKLVKLLRLLGYDAIFFGAEDDSNLVTMALGESRVILTRDTQIVKRRLISHGRLKAILIRSDDPEQQMRQVMATLNLGYQSRPFTRCLECNHGLLEKDKEQIKGLVPPYVFQTQDHYMECPACHRIYWRGTHWQAMSKRLEKLMNQATYDTTQEAC